MLSIPRWRPTRTRRECDDRAVDRRALTRLLGPWPTKVPLHAATTEVTLCGSYCRERVEYDVEAGERIAAYVLVPQDRPPRAAVFVHHQHADEYGIGKSEVVGLAGDPDQSIGVDLVRRGYLVLAPDAFGFEDRNTDGGTSRTVDRAAAHRLVSRGTLLAKVLHDVQVGLDYLQARPDVVRTRFGFVGHSYGGRMAIWVPTFDRRVAVSVSHCGALTYADHLRLGLPIQPEFVVPGIAERTDLGEIAGLVRADLLLSSTTEDRWSPSAQSVYDTASAAGGNVSLRLWPGGHVFTAEMRAAAYAFLDARLGERSQ